MNNQSPITKHDLVSTLKELGIANKDDLREMESRQDKKYATKDDLQSLATKDDLKPLATKEDLKKLERSLKLRIGKERNKILAGVSQLATKTPTLRSFEDLRERVNRSIASS